MSDSRNWETLNGLEFYFDVKRFRKQGSNALTAYQIWNKYLNDAIADRKRIFPLERGQHSAELALLLTEIHSTLQLSSLPPPPTLFDGLVRMLTCSVLGYGDDDAALQPLTVSAALGLVPIDLNREQSPPRSIKITSRPNSPTTSPSLSPRDIAPKRQHQSDPRGHKLTEGGLSPRGVITTQPSQLPALPPVPSPVHAPPNALLSGSSSTPTANSLASSSGNMIMSASTGHIPSMSKEGSIDRSELSGKERERENSKPEKERERDNSKENTVTSSSTATTGQSRAEIYPVQSRHSKSSNFPAKMKNPAVANVSKIFGFGRKDSSSAKDGDAFPGRENAIKKAQQDGEREKDKDKERLRKQTSYTVLDAKPSKDHESIKRLCDDLCSACWNNDVAAFKQILIDDDVRFILTSVNSRLQTPLYCVARQGHFELLQVLLRLCKHLALSLDVQVQPHLGTALHAACYGGKVDCAAALLIAGASPKIQNSVGLTAFDEALSQQLLALLPIYEREGSEGIKKLYSKKFMKPDAQFDLIFQNIERRREDRKERANEGRGGGKGGGIAFDLALPSTMAIKEFGRLMRLTVVGSKMHIQQMMTILHLNNSTPSQMGSFLVGDTLVRIHAFPLTIQNRFAHKQALQQAGLVLFLYSSDATEIGQYKRLKEFAKYPYLMVDMGTHRRDAKDKLALMRSDASEASMAVSQQGTSPPQTPSSSSASSSLAYAMPPPIPSGGGANYGYAAGSSSQQSGGGSAGGGATAGQNRAIMFDRSMSLAEKHDAIAAHLGVLLREPDFQRKATFEAVHFHKFWPKFIKLRSTTKITTSEKIMELFFQSIFTYCSEINFDEIINHPAEERCVFQVCYPQGTFIKSVVSWSNPKDNLSFATCTVQDLLEKKFHGKQFASKELIILNSNLEVVAQDALVKDRLKSGIIHVVPNVTQRGVLDALHGAGWIHICKSTHNAGGVPSGVGTGQDTADQTKALAGEIVVLDMTVFTNLSAFFTQKQFLHEYPSLLMPSERLTEYCALNYPQDPQLLMDILRTNKLFHLENRITKKLFLPVLVLNQQKKKALIYYSQKKERKMNRYFVLSERLYFGYFETLYLALFPLFHSLQSFCWSDRRTATVTVLYKCSQETVLLVYFEANLICVEFAGVASEEIIFARMVHSIRDLLRHLFTQVTFEELINCPRCLEGHPYYLADMYDLKLSQPGGLDAEVTCPHTLKCTPLDSLAPDFQLPLVRTFKKPLQLREILGEGSFGLVRKAVAEDGTKYAVKSFKGEKLHSMTYETFFEFLSEATMHSGLDCKYLVRFHGAMLPDYSLVLELVPEGVLGELLHGDPPVDLSVQLRKKFALDVAHGLLYLHTLEVPIIHRDIRSYNIFIMSRELPSETGVNAKIGDFGLSVPAYALLKEPLESWQWLAPEVILGLPYDERSDLYSFGVVIYEIFSRTLPFTDIPELLKGAEFITLDAKEKICAGLRPLLPPFFSQDLIDILNALWHPAPVQRLALPTFIARFQSIAPVFEEIMLQRQSSQDNKQAGFALRGPVKKELMKRNPSLRNTEFELIAFEAIRNLRKRESDSFLKLCKRDSRFLEQAVANGLENPLKNEKEVGAEFKGLEVESSSSSDDEAGDDVDFDGIVESPEREHTHHDRPAPHVPAHVLTNSTGHVPRVSPYERDGATTQSTLHSSTTGEGGFIRTLANSGGQARDGRPAAMSSAWNITSPIRPLPQTVLALREANERNNNSGNTTNSSTTGGGGGGGYQPYQRDSSGSRDTTAVLRDGSAYQPVLPRETFRAEREALDRTEDRTLITAPYVSARQVGFQRENSFGSSNSLSAQTPSSASSYTSASFSPSGPSQRDYVNANLTNSAGNSSVSQASSYSTASPSFQSYPGYLPSPGNSPYQNNSPNSPAYYTNNNSASPPTPQPYQSGVPLPRLSVRRGPGGSEITSNANAQSSLHHSGATLQRADSQPGGASTGGTNSANPTPPSQSPPNPASPRDRFGMLEEGHLEDVSLSARERERELFNQQQAQRDRESGKDAQRKDGEKGERERLTSTELLKRRKKITANMTDGINLKTY